ncbi:MAG: lytic transglycosylase domain-containing protein [Bacteroidales bacterium]|nr:lytic transglycosylase domain-containing protein [Bacteroidales bacterium]
MTKKRLIITILLLAGAGAAFMGVAIDRNQDDWSGEPVESNNSAYYQNIITTPPVPETLDFAGETVPLKIYWVREALERELINHCYQHSRTLQIVKRTGRYFPLMKQILEEEGVPKDFLYLCVAESGLENVVSPAKAAGFWQFMETTAKKYGLEIRDEVDERYHLKKATHAACQYLKRCKKELGSWSLAAAAYNMGANGVKTAIENQSSNNYWDLYLNTETARYLYRILAYKLMFENTEQYGIKVCASDMYHPVPCKEIKIDASIDNLYAYAKAHNLTYRELKTLNPWLRSTKLTFSHTKSYNLQLPITPKQCFNELFRGIQNPHVLIHNISR